MTTTADPTNADPTTLPTGCLAPRDFPGEEEEYRKYSRGYDAALWLGGFHREEDMPDGPRLRRADYDASRWRGGGPSLAERFRYAAEATLRKWREEAVVIEGRHGRWRRP